MRTNCLEAWTEGRRPEVGKTKYQQRLSLLIGLLILNACNAGAQPAQGSGVEAAARVSAARAKTEESRMWMTVGEHRFAITLTDSVAARAFAAQLPLKLDMAELNGNEKHAQLPKALPTKSRRQGAIRKGDLMLYGSNTLVVFYSTFESSYSYSSLGQVDDPTGLAKALGPRDVRVIFSND